MKTKYKKTRQELLAQPIIKKNSAEIKMGDITKRGMEIDCFVQAIPQK